jgi:hypothetical protein
VTQGGSIWNVTLGGTIGNAKYGGSIGNVKQRGSIGKIQKSLGGSAINIWYGCLVTILELAYMEINNK